MYREFRRNLYIPALTAALLLLFLAVIPILIDARNDFLGKDVSGLAVSIVSYYPGYFVRELLKVGCVVFFSIFAICTVFFFLRKYLMLRGWPGLSIFPGAPLLILFFLFCSSLFRYPALYESLVSIGIQKMVFRSAAVLSPAVFMGIVYLLMASGLIAIGWRVRKARKIFASSAAVAAVAFFLRLCPDAPVIAGGKPYNILLISVDSLRSDYIKNALTPELTDFRADRSTMDFQNHYIGVPRTFPSWVELLYARYAPSTGVRHMFPGFGDRRQQTRPLPLVLSGHDYKTAVISDFAGDVFPRFESGFETVRTPSMNLRALIELSVHQKFPLFLPVTTSDVFSGFFPSLVQNPAFADPQRLVRQFSELVGSSTPKPWFTTVFFSTAHFPYAAPHPYYRTSTDPAYKGPFFFQKNPEITGAETLTADNIAQTRGLYMGALSAIDSSIRDIFEKLKSSGQWDHTIVIVTADHGEDLYENGRLQGHGEHLLGQNVLKVPFFVRVPGLDFSGRSPASFVTRSIDVGTTIAGAAGIEWNETQGENLFTWLSGTDEGSPPALTAYSETGIWFSAGGKGEFQQQRLAYPGISGLLNFDHGMSQEIVLNPDFEKIVTTAKHRAVVRGDHKLVYVPTEDGVRFLLFNEKNDPDNLMDLAGSEPENLGKMKAVFFDTVARLEPDSKWVGDYIIRR